MAYLVGVLLALANAFGARKVGLDEDGAFYPIVLAVVASYYVLFAVMDGTLGVVAIEVVIDLLFLAVVTAGLRRNLWWIAAGLLAHGLLDTVHGRVITNHGVPTWWPAFCASYDFAAAAVLGAMLIVRDRRLARTFAEVSNA